MIPRASARRQSRRDTAADVAERMFRPGLDDLADVYDAGRGLLAVGLSPACTPELVDEILTAVGIRLLPLRPLAAGGPAPEPHRHDDAPDWLTGTWIVSNQPSFRLTA